MRGALLVLALALPVAAKDPKPEDLMSEFCLADTQELRREEIREALVALVEGKRSTVLGALKKVKPADPVLFVRLVAELDLADDGWKWVEPLLRGQEHEPRAIAELGKATTCPGELLDLWLVRDPAGPSGTAIEELLAGKPAWASELAPRLGKLLGGKDRPNSAARILAPVLGLASGGPLEES